jgi:hypothetical protein
MFGRFEVSAKSNPGDGSHGRGVKGGKTDGPAAGPLSFLLGLWRGLTGLRNR